MRCQTAAGIISLIAVFGCSHTDEHRVANPTPGTILPTAGMPSAAKLAAPVVDLTPDRARTLPDRSNFIAAEPAAEKPRHRPDYDY